MASVTERVLRNSYAERLKDMVAEINADAERIGVVMTLEEEIQHQLRRRDRVWQDKLDEKDALLGRKDAQLAEQEKLIADLQRQIETLNAKA